MFGLDIGSQSVKFVQLDSKPKHAVIKAYGSIATDDEIMKGGVIEDVDKAAKLIDTLLSKNAVGTLTTNRVTIGIPVSHVYTRVVNLPLMSRKEFDSAVKLEIEESVPVAIKNLYYDYEMNDTGDSDNLLIRMVAAPRGIVDSYVEVCDKLGLDLALVQTNIKADAQLCMSYENLDPNSPYIIIDVGGNSIDVGILDTTLRITGTVEEGGNSLTDAIAKELNVSKQQANDIKVIKGVSASKQQKQILKAVSPILDKVITEIKRMMRFYEERVQSKTPVSQILIVGGGANMPGLGDYLTNATHIATRVSSPWGSHITFGKIEPPEHADLPRFLTCAGLAMATDEEALEQ